MFPTCVSTLSRLEADQRITSAYCGSVAITSSPGPRYLNMSSPRKPRAFCVSGITRLMSYPLIALKAMRALRPPLR